MELAKRRGGVVLRHLESEVEARWSVPWSLWKGVVIDVESAGGVESDMLDVWTHEWKPNTQVFESRGAR